MRLSLNRVRVLVGLTALAACSEEARRPTPSTASPPVSTAASVAPEDLALCEAVRDAAPARCGSERCRQRYELLRVLFKDMLGTAKCAQGSKDFRLLCKGATERQLWQCQDVSQPLRPLCDALASHDATACHPGGGRECVDLFQAAVGISRGNFDAIAAIREPALKVAARAALGRLDCAAELRR